MNAPPPHPELARAAQFDAAGNFDEAINSLARGTREGDAACAGQLGMRLLTGHNSPLLPAEGLQFIGEACDKGWGEGAARAAGVVALGNGGMADWRRSLEWLCRSAEAGWKNSQRQLMALADDRALAQEIETRAAVQASAPRSACRLPRGDHWPRPSTLNPGAVRPPRRCAPRIRAWSRSAASRVPSSAGSSSR